MKLKRFLSYMALGLMAVLPFTACDGDDDNWQAGSPVSKNSIGAYFASSNSSSIINTPEGFETNPTFTLTVCREVTTGAASVGIEVVKNPGNMTVPAKVDFADGEAEATITIDYSGIPLKQSCALSLKLEDAMTNPYKEQPGLASYAGSVLVSEWVKVGSQVPFKFRNTGLAPIYHDIYHLDGVNLFRIDNFLNSGVNFQFSISGSDKFDNNNISTWTGAIVPESNAAMYTDFWYLIDDEGNSATGHTGDNELWYIYFWLGADYGYIAFDFYNAGYNVLLFTPGWDTKESEEESGYEQLWDYIDAEWILPEE